jgi:hypothetical protein
MVMAVFLALDLANEHSPIPAGNIESRFVRPFFTPGR